MIHVIFGGQYGSEGKGAFCAYMARQKHYAAAVRGGGPQAGHTFFDDRFGGKCVVRQIPVAAVVDRSTIGYIGPGAVIDLATIQDEYMRFDFPLTRNLRIHPNACLVEAVHKDEEHSLEGGGYIPGSTKEGVGAARAGRALRMATTAGEFAKSGWMADIVDSDLKVYDRILHWADLPGHLVMAEGAQGFGLSLWHGAYPYVTSADTTPTAILSECGLPIFGVERVIAVLRTFPIRVGGNSGPLPNEISWAELPPVVGRLSREPETTTVTGRQRRIAKFDWAHFYQMVRVCRPSHAALMFADYLDSEIRTKPLGDASLDLIGLWAQINKTVSTPWLGVGGERFEIRGAMEGMFTTVGQRSLEVNDGKA